MRAAVLTLMMFLLLAVVPAAGLRVAGGCGQTVVAADSCPSVEAVAARTAQKADLPGKCIDILLPAPLASASAGRDEALPFDREEAMARLLAASHWRPPRAVS